MTDTNVATIPQNKHPIVVMRERFEMRKSELKAALPHDIDADQFIRAITTSAQINPDLQACSFNSLWLACMRACRDGLLPDGREAAIVPYKTTATYIPMYQGLLKNFRKSGQCRWIAADVVRSGETFEHYVDETGEHFKHVPGDTDGNVVKVYAAALTKEGAFHVAVLSMRDIDKIRAMSRATRDDAPWKMWPEEMQKKSALRRLSKMLPSGRDIIPDDDMGFGLPGLEAPPLQPLPPPAAQDEPRRPQGAAASLDSFAGSSTSPDGDPPQAAPGDGGGSANTHTTDATAATVSVEEIEDAYAKGKKAKLDGMARKALPGELRDPSRSHESIAWQAGFDGKPLPTWNNEDAPQNE
jgi:recombination protein RecT